MKNKLLLVLVIFLLIQCKKTTIPVSSVIDNLTISNYNLLADGYSSDTATVALNNDAYSSKRYVVFKITGALASKDTTKINVVPATYLNGQLNAQIIFKAPLKPGMIYISASPLLDTFDQRNFTLNDSLRVNASIPSSIKLNPSGFGIQTSFGSEVMITGVLKNIFNNPVSLGNSVMFVDSLKNGNSAMGEFRQVVNPSDSMSKVSVGYSIFSGNVGDKITIKAFVLDSSGMRLPFSDSTTLTVTK